MPTAAPVNAKRALSDYLRAKSHPAEFIDLFCRIQDSNTGSSARFRLWDFQRDLLDIWLQNRLCVVLKARQLGISWLSTALALWVANFYEDVNIICLSKSQEKAWGLIDKVKFMYDNLPPHLKKEIVRRNRGEIVFKGETTEEGSKIMALPSTPGSAVSYTASVLIVDEWAEQEYAEELYTSFKPTVDMGGRVIGISTGSDIGSFFHEIWKQARAGENGFKPIFLAYDKRPGRTTEWYENTRRTYPNEQAFYQQYPRNEVEAFLAAGGCPFNIDDINWYLESTVRPPLEASHLAPEKEAPRIPEQLVRFLDFDELQVWEMPQLSHAYLISMDPATGQEGGDYHAIQVIKLDDLEQVLEFRSRCDLDIAVNAAWEIARLYNMAELVWERTGIGNAVTTILSRLGYPNLYQHEEDDGTKTPARNKQLKLGWPSTRANNYRRDTDLIAGIRDHDIKIHSARWFDEAKGFVRRADGTYGSTGRAHDDLVTSMGMGFHLALQRGMRRSERLRPIRTTKRRAFRRETWR